MVRGLRRRFKGVLDSRWGVEQGYQVIYHPIEADLEAWEEHVEEGLDSLMHGVSSLEHTQEDADIGEEILGA